MQNILAVVVSASLLAGCLSPRSPESWAAHAVRRNPALTTCDIDQQRLDVAHIEPRDLSNYDQEVAPYHLRTRGPNHPLPAPADAQIVLRMFAGGDPHQQAYTDTSSVLWKDSGGAWHVDAVDYRPWPQPPPPQPDQPQRTPAELEEQMREVTVGLLAAGQIERLETALASPCFGSQPDYVPIVAPMLGGTFEGCHGGVSGGVLEITRAGVTRRILDGCARWAAGDIMRVVMYPRAEGVRAGADGR